MRSLLLSLVATAVAVRMAIDASASARVRCRVTASAGAASITVPPVVARVVDRLLAGRRQRALARALPHALDDVARSLRSGGSLRMAIAEASTRAPGELGADLTRVVRGVDEGEPMSDALASWIARRPVPGVRLAATALSLASETGGASARAIDGVAATLRVNLGIAGEVKALASQARLSALVIVLAPVAFTALAATTDRRTTHFLVGTPFGLLCLAGGLTLDAIGWAWMRRITAVDA